MASRTDARVVIGADIDGTLAYPNQDITPENIALCAALEQLGIPIVLSTGKATDYAWKNALKFGGKVVFAENHAVLSTKPGTYEVYGPNLDDLITLRQILGLSPIDEGVCKMFLFGDSGEVVVEEGKRGVLTIFTEQEPVQHCWRFKQRWDRALVHECLRQFITGHRLKLHVLEPHQDGAIDVVRLDEHGDPIDKRSFVDLCRKLFPNAVKFAFFGDGTNDLPAMLHPEVIGVTFSDADPKVIQAMADTGNIVTNKAALDRGIFEGIIALVKREFFDPVFSF